MAAAVAQFLGVTHPKDLVVSVMKFGPSWIMLAFLIHFLTAGIGADVRGGRDDHRELAFYLRQICVGVNSQQANAWQQCQPPRDK